MNPSLKTSGYKYRHAILVLAGWLTCIVIAYWPILIGRTTLTPTNMLYYARPWSSQQVAISGPLLSDPVDGILTKPYATYYGSGYAAWDGRIGVGLPVGIEVIINPFNWFFMVPLKYAYIVKSLFKFSVAYFGMCWFLRTLKLNWTAAVVGAVSYAFSSAMVMWHFWPHTDVMSLAPVAMGLSRKLMDERKLRDMFFLGIVVFLLLVAEMPTYGAYVLYLMGFYVLFSAAAQYRKQIKKLLSVYVEFGAACILGIAACLPYIYTLFESVVDNGYAASRSGQATSTLAKVCLRSILLPYNQQDISIHPNEYTVYFGIVACVLLLFTFIGIRRKKRYFWPLALGTLFVTVYTHRLDFIFTRMPAVNTSVKARIIVILVFAAATVAAINLDDILENADIYRKKKYHWLAYICAIPVFVFILMKYFTTDPWAMVTLATVILVVFILELSIESSKVKWNQLLKFALVILAATGMGRFARGYMPFIAGDASVIPEPTDTVQYLQENSGTARYLPFGGWVLFPETNEYYGLSCICAHNFVNTDPEVKSFLRSIDDGIYASPTRTMGTKVDSTNMLSYAGVRYVVKPADLEVDTGDTELVYTGEDGLEVYEVSDYAPRFYLSQEIISCNDQAAALDSMKQSYQPGRVHMLADEAGDAVSAEWTDADHVEVASDTGGRIVLNVESSADRILVFNDYNHPNWTVTVDGEAAFVITANYLFNGVEVGPGKHVVEFVYDTSTTRKLCIVMGAALFIMMAGIVVTWALEKRRARTDIQA